MSERHGRVRELFLAALERSELERADFLRRSGAAPADLQQVMDLLQHASPGTILDVRPPTARSQWSSSSSLGRFLRVLEPFASNRLRVRVTGILFFALLLAGGRTLRSKLRAQASESALSTLQALEESTSTSFQSQVHEWQAVAEAVVSPELGRQAAIDVIRDPNPKNLAHLRQYAASLVLPGRFQRYYLVDAQGTFRAIDDQPAVMPSPATPFGMEMFSRAFNSGKTVMAVPGWRRTMVAFGGRELAPTVSFYVPLMEGDRKIGVFVATRSMESLANSLKKGQVFKTGESYVFSSEGMLLSRSRFEEQMGKNGASSSGPFQVRGCPPSTCAIRAARSPARQSPGVSNRLRGPSPCWSGK